MKRYDTVIIGGGFYGLRIAQFLVDELGIKDILVVEKEADVMQHASYNNQARVHNGYHYPRSVLTALRSRVNLPVFSKEYEEAINKDFTKYYAVARQFSKVSARQFLRFFERIEAEIETDVQGMRFFDSRLIEQVFKVKEYGFNSAILRRTLMQKIAERNIAVHTGESVQRIARSASGIEVTTDKTTYSAKHVLNTSYSLINLVNDASALPMLPLKHELTEMCLVNMPPELADKAFTIMCGPFFSLMPFPDKQAYTMSHVRYTPHREWHDNKNGTRNLYELLKKENRPASNFPLMSADIRRYMPHAKDITYTGESLWEIKTVLQSSESDDSRPILYKEHYGGIRNYICIMGAKIDNIYDVFRELRESYA